MTKPERVTVVGGGLAGSEAAWQLAERGFDVRLYEMRPVRKTAAHQTERLGELVCSNTFKSTEVTNAHGLLKAEMRALNCMILDCADEARVAAGSALAVDRDMFASAVTSRLESQPRIEIVREEVTSLPDPGIVATGPLTSDALAKTIAARLGANGLAFYDAIAPIVSIESIDESLVFLASRYGKETMEGEEDGAYLNCPMSRQQYDEFIDALIAADQFHGHQFDEVPYFEGCMPVEESAKRGKDTLRFGPMKPVGLRDPRTGREAGAIVQLRREDRAGRMWNLVGFQTRLRIPEQQRVFRMIPGLENAEFLRYGSIHRNSYINSPATLSPHLSTREGNTFFAGQLTGVEGYTESSATGLLAGINMARTLSGDAPVIPPATTMLGALYRYMREADPRHFQPMNANFGLLDDLAEPVRDKKKKRECFARRALDEMHAFAAQIGIRPSVVAVMLALFLVLGTANSADAQAKKWFRGNTHTHTTNSDGDSPPDSVVQWYRNAKYDFLFITDHERITDPAPLNERFASKGSFVVIPGEEVTQIVADSSHPNRTRQAHVNALGLRRLVLPLGEKRIASGISMKAGYARNIAEIRAAGGIPQINHPNFRWSVRLEDLTAIGDSVLLEIWNAHTGVNNLGGVDAGGRIVPSAESLWDSLLTRGIVVFGVADDDSHSFRALNSDSYLHTRPGRGWIMVRADTLSEAAVLGAIRRGEFYASTGVTLSEINTGGGSTRATVAPVGDNLYTFEFIGSGGRVLSTVHGRTATYVIRGDERYVRVRVTNSNGQKAWTQATWVTAR